MWFSVIVMLAGVGLVISASLLPVTPPYAGGPPDTASILVWCGILLIAGGGYGLRIAYMLRRDE